MIFKYVVLLEELIFDKIITSESINSLFVKRGTKNCKTLFFQ